MKLTIKQTIALDYLEDNLTKEVIFGGGAGGAKSVLGCYWLAKMCLRYPGTRWVMGRAVLKTLRETTLNSFFWVMSQQGLKTGEHYRYNGQSNIISFPNGSEILLKDLYTYPSDPNFDELGSLEITGAFVDECNQIDKKAWNILKSRIRYRLDEYELTPKILGTCNPAKNWVYSDFFKPKQQGNLPKDKQFIQALLSDNPFISKHYRDNLLSLDKVSKMRLLFGDWTYDDDPAALMSIDRINDIFTNTFVEGGEKFITADVARFGSDRAVIMVWDGFRVVKIVAFDKSSITQLAEVVRELSHTYHVPLSNIIADADGVGGGLVDVLGCVEFVNNSRPLEEEGSVVQYQNLKSQCYFHIARKINNNEIFICETEYKDEIIQELEQVKRHNVDKDGKLSILPKDKVKELLGRSPDFADALMMRMWFDYRFKFEFSIA